MPMRDKPEDRRHGWRAFAASLQPGDQFKTNSPDIDRANLRKYGISSKRLGVQWLSKNEESGERCWLVTYLAAPKQHRDRSPRFHPYAYSAIAFAVTITNHSDRLAFLQAWLTKKDLPEWREYFEVWKARKQHTRKPRRLGV